MMKRVYYDSVYDAIGRAQNILWLEFDVQSRAEKLEFTTEQISQSWHDENLNLGVEMQYE